MRSFEEKLQLYAQMTVSQGLGLQGGQELLVFAETDQTQFVRLIAKEAYRAGSKNVEVLWKDPGIARTRYQHGTDQCLSYSPSWLHDGVARAHRDGAARLAVVSNDPELLADLPPERIATAMKAHAMATREVSALVSDDAMNWCLVGAASPGWAQRVFPSLNPAEATARLWEAIFLTSRILEADPIAAWDDHMRTLAAKMQWLNELALDAVHFRGPGTDLRVGLAEGHIWCGGRSKSRNGVVSSPNIPTEEIFTMPHRARVDGVASSTKPLSLRGQLVEGIRVEFREGAAVRASAAKGGKVLQDLIQTDEGAARLGEVALVPNSSKVSQAGLLFLNSLYDENAASHIAFGAAYGKAMTGYADATEALRTERGANASIIHVDWMIGSGEVDIDGVLLDGSHVPLMRSGEWA